MLAHNPKRLREEIYQNRQGSPQAIAEPVRTNNNNNNSTPPSASVSFASPSIINNTRRTSKKGSSSPQMVGGAAADGGIMNSLEKTGFQMSGSQTLNDMNSLTNQNLPGEEDLPKTPTSDNGDDDADVTPHEIGLSRTASSVTGMLPSGSSGAVLGNLSGSTTTHNLRSKGEQNLRQVMDFINKLSQASCAEPKMTLEVLLDSFGYAKEAVDSSDDDDERDSASGIGSSVSFHFGAGSDVGSSVFGSASPLGGFGLKGLATNLTRFSSELAHRCWIENNPHLLSPEQREARNAGWRPKKAEAAELQKVMVPWRGQSAILFVDISGYSKTSAELTDKGGAHALSSAVNLYFESILSICQQHHGDCVTYAGDACVIVWPCSSVRKPLEVCLAACACAIDLQLRAGSSKVEGTDLSFGIHCAITFGAIESSILKAPYHANNNEAYHFVSGHPFVETSILLDAAKRGQTAISESVFKIVHSYSRTEQISHSEGASSPKALAASSDLKQNSSTNNFENLTATMSTSATSHKRGSVSELTLLRSQRSLGYLLLGLDEDYKEVLDNQVTDLRIQRSVWLERALVPVSVSSKLKQGFKAAHIAEMRFLCVLFVRKNVETVGAEAWFYETHQILDECRCPIVQILHDDKGTHLVAAVGLYSTEMSPANTGILAARKLWERDTGCVVGVACGEVFCGITGSEAACRWDITGPACVRAARLMQHGVQKNMPVVIDASVAAFTDDDSQLQPSGQIKIKGAASSVRVYSLVPISVSVTAGIVNIPWVSPLLHREERKKIEDEFLNTIYQRAIFLGSGAPGCGKKTTLVQALNNVGVNNIFHFSTRDETPLTLIATVASWFSHHLDPEIAQLGTSARTHLSSGRITQTLNVTHQAINLFIKKGLSLVVCVTYVNLLDKSSIDFIKSVVMTPPTPGTGRFFFAMTCYSLWGFPSPKELENEFSLTLRENIRIRETLENHQDAMRMQTDLPSVKFSYATSVQEFGDAFSGLTWYKLRDHCARILLEATGGCLMLIEPIVDLCRAQFMSLMAAKDPDALSKAWMPATNDGTVHLTTAGEDYFLNEIDWKRAAPKTASRFQELYDALPPRLQLVLRVIASLGNTTGAANINHLVHVVRKLNSKISADRIKTDVELLIEAQILKIPNSSDESEVYFSVPAMVDVVASLLTPTQDSAIKRIAFKLAYAGYVGEDPNLDPKKLVDPSWWPIFVSFIAKFARGAKERDIYGDVMKDAWRSYLELLKNGNLLPDVKEKLEARIKAEHRRYPKYCRAELFDGFDIKPDLSHNKTEAELEFLSLPPLERILVFVTEYQPPFSLGAISGEMQQLLWSLAANTLDFTRGDRVFVDERMRKLMRVDVEALMSYIEKFEEAFPDDKDHTICTKPLESQLRYIPNPGEDTLYDDFVSPPTLADEKKLLIQLVEYPKDREEALVKLRLFRAYHFKTILPRRDRAVSAQQQIVKPEDITCPRMLAANDAVKKAYLRLCRKYPIPNVDIHHSIMDLATGGFRSKYFYINLQIIRDQVLRQHVATVNDFKAYLTSLHRFGDEITHREWSKISQPPSPMTGNAGSGGAATFTDDPPIARGSTTTFADVR